MYESNIVERDYQEIEDDDEEPEKFDERQRIKSIIKQNQVLRSRMVIFEYISENPEQAPERREETNKDWKRGWKQAFLEGLGIESAVLKKEKADLDRMIKSDRKTTTDLNTKAYGKKSSRGKNWAAWKRKRMDFSAS